jgi:ATP-dependent protease HslVU (ClpYQ) peptidase subunit
MTVIAVRKYDDKIVIAADSQTTYGDDYKILTATKIVRQDNIVFGCAGSCSDISLFRMFTRTHKPKAATEDDVVDFLSEFVDWKKKKTNNADYVSSIIIIMDNVVFRVQSYSVRAPIETFFAIGSGMFSALAAMELDADPIKAVEIAIKYNTGCGGKVESLEIPIK